MTRDLEGIAGKEMLVLVVEYPPGGVRSRIGTMRRCSSTCSKAR